MIEIVCEYKCKFMHLIILFTAKRSYLCDNAWLGAEHEKQLVEEVEEQALEIVSLGFHVVHLCDLHALQICHVTEHGHRALLESFLHGIAPCVQSTMQSHILV